MNEIRNVYQRMQKVMEAVAYVKKDKTVDGAGGGYRAVTHDMVTAMVRPHFLAHGIIIVPRLVAGATVQTGRTTKAGTPIIRFEGTYEVSFVNVDAPDDRIVMTTAAHAEDQGDKAPGKALRMPGRGMARHATSVAFLKYYHASQGMDGKTGAGTAAMAPAS